jgi:PD-(D/E)XK nuclease superfamily
VTQKPTLRIASSPREAWEGAIAPWFREVLPNSWKQELPSVVVVPTRSRAHALKARLLEERRSHLGIRFVTPAGLRDLLSGDRRTVVPLREHLRLLLAIAAEQENNGENLAAKAVLRAPDNLLRILDRLETAGWDFERIGPAAFHGIARRFREQLRACGFCLVGEFDRDLLSRALKNPPLVADLLITGFDGAHWPHWHLLRAAVAAATKATIVLKEPRGDLSDVDLCWIGSWEEVCGEAKREAKPRAASADSLFTEAEMRGVSNEPKLAGYLVATNAAEQAEAIAAQCVRYLAGENCTRLGVIFPGPGALPRLVGDALSARNIAHNDGFAHPLPGIFEAQDWQAWLQLQSSPRLNSFLRFFHTLSDPAILQTELSASALEKILRESWAEVLLDDLEVLTEHCRKGGQKPQAAAAVLRSVRYLPARTTFSQFLDETQAALDDLGWTQRATEIRSTALGWPDHLTPPITRAVYLRWLSEAAASRTPGRTPMGDHPYARVQLLSVPEAQNQEWSHLILAGCNEGNWPPPAGAEFGRDEEIRAFNSSIQKLNKRAARQGSQGEGHTSVRGHHSLYLGPVEQRAIVVRQLEALIESTGEAMTSAASLLQEDAPERLWNPSESLSQLYHSARSEPLTQAALKSLHQATTAWVAENRPLLRRAPNTSGDARQTLTAFTTRRNAATKAGEYDFGLRPNESFRPVPTVSVSDLEEMVSSPAIVWMKRYLGVKAPDDTSNPWAATSGKWVHVWLAAIGEADPGRLFAPFPSSAKLDQAVQSSADERRALLQEICRSLGKTIPDWWLSGWLNARYLARHLGAKIAGATSWKWMTAEYGVGRDGPVRIADAVELRLHGRIDLVLARTESTDFTGQNIWIVDYKTGATKELKDSDLHDALVKGTALQLGLYALALRALGAAQVGASILSSAVRKVAPQLSAADLAPHTNVFADLAEMQQTGIFGMKGEIRPAFGYSAAYPLATLAIDEEVLEDKWQRTHGNLVLEKEEWERW